MSEYDPNILDAHKEETLEEERQELRPWGWAARGFFLLGVFLLATVITAQAILIVPQSIAPRPVAALQSTIASVFPFSLLPRVGSNLLSGELDDRVNVLVSGIGGAGHDGPYLTDTILLVSYQPSINTVALLSIPRDLFVPGIPPAGRKINAIGTAEEVETPGSGAPMLANVVGKLLGQNVHYYFRVDFTGFTELVDRIDSIEVVVDRTFEDPRYPIIGEETNKDLSKRYEILRISEGRQKFDGATALKFARSRYGNNGEGSDFSRMRRQQKVIAALKEKLMRPSLLRPRSIGALANLLQNHVVTNINFSDIFRLQEILNSNPRIVAKSLDLSDGLLRETRGLDGAYLLEPKGADYTALSRVATQMFTDGRVIANTPPVRVDVFNTTNISGLAARVGVLLDKEGFQVTRVTNASPSSPLSETFVYDRSNGQRGYEARHIAELIGGTMSTQTPSWIQSDAAIVVVLGSDAALRLTVEQ